MAINLQPTSEVEEVMQNIRTILATPIGTAPMDRGLGISGTWLDLPLTKAQALMTSDIIDAVTKYEPRAQVLQVSFTKDESTGQLSPSVTFALASGGVYVV